MNSHLARTRVVRVLLLPLAFGVAALSSSVLQRVASPILAGAVVVASLVVLAVGVVCVSAALGTLPKRNRVAQRAPLSMTTESRIQSVIGTRIGMEGLSLVRLAGAAVVVVGTLRSPETPQNAERLSREPGRVPARFRNAAAGAISSAVAIADPEPGARWDAGGVRIVRVTRC